jgi:DNA-binding CsgD family transcriptional regulator
MGNFRRAAKKQKNIGSTGAKMKTFVKQLDVPRLNSIFDNITREMGCVFWMRALDAQTQIYISPNYENIWGMSCDTLYQYPESWMEKLLDEDKDRLLKNFENMKKTAVSTSTNTYQNAMTSFYRTSKKNANGHILYMCDRVLVLGNEKKQPIAFAGIGLPSEESHWTKQMNEEIQVSPTPLEKGFFLLIHEILKLTPQPLNTLFKTHTAPIEKNIVYFKNSAYKLSLREAQCLFYSANGYSAKGVAKNLKLSPRTIETHLENIKNKLHCRNKLELIGNVDISLLSADSLQLNPS